MDIGILAGQPGEKRVRREVHLFSEVWRAFRDPVAYVVTPADNFVQLNEDQSYEFTRNELMAMIDEAMAAEND